ncbi:unnamed protein product [Paramecium sonneborni]|uniref:Uncharacterized protein n=1 Tax=Paramecium sonneborni TaxID=65129 RepID=A0A8S1NY98_9CILI|nr:unnamed protein product [Paramecium sonneborni]
MHFNQICHLHNQVIQFICLDERCPAEICQKCFESDKYHESKEKNQIIPKKKFIDILNQLIQKKEKNDDMTIQNLEKTFNNFQEFYLEVKQSVQAKNDEFLKIKQYIERLEHFNSPKFLQNIKQRFAYKFLTPLKELQQDKQLKQYIECIDNSIKQTREFWLKTQQEKLSQLIDTQPILIKEKQDKQISIIDSNENLNLHQKLSLKKNKELEKNIQITLKQQLAFGQDDQQFIQDNNVISIEHPNYQIIQQKNAYSFNQQDQQPINSQYQNDPEALAEKNKINFQVNQKDFQIQESQQSNDFEIMKKSNFKLEIEQKQKIFKKSFELKAGNNSILKIEVINANKLIYLDERNNINLITNYKSQKNLKKVEKQFQQKIIDFRITKNDQILVQTNQNLILFDNELKNLCQIDEIIEKNHLDTFSYSKIQDKGINIIYYLKNTKKIFASLISFNQIITQWEQDLKQIIDFPVIQLKKIENNLFIGFQNGTISIYDPQTQNQRGQLRFDADSSKIFQEIQFNENFILGCQENQLYLLSYNNQTKLLLSTNQKIISIASQFNKIDEYEIHLLQENQRVHVQLLVNQKIKSQERKINGITCICFFKNKKNIFYYGNQNGYIYSYQIGFE